MYNTTVKFEFLARTWTFKLFGLLSCCAKQALLSFKAEDVLYKAQYVAWTLEKTKYVLGQAKEIEHEVCRSCPVFLLNKFRSSTKKDDSKERRKSIRLH